MITPTTDDTFTSGKETHAKDANKDAGKTSGNGPATIPAMVRQDFRQ